MKWGGMPPRKRLERQRRTEAPARRCESPGSSGTLRGPHDQGRPVHVADRPRDADQRRQPVLDLAVAAGTLNIVPSDVKVVDEFRVPVAVELLRLIVAGEAPVARRLAVALDDVQVALRTGDAATDQLLVVEPDRADHDVAFRRSVTPGAAGDGLQLPPDLHPLEVAEEAGGLRHLDVGPHDDLGVTARAPELPPAADLLEVGAVIKDDPPFEHHLALQESPLMTTRAEATRILDLGERLRAIRLRGPLRHLGERLVLDPEGVPEAGRVMTLNTRYHVVLGGPPRLHERHHDVPGTTEQRARAHLVEADEDGKADHEQGGEADQEGAPAPGPLR